jgi:hypothetical protein
MESVYPVELSDLPKSIQSSFLFDQPDLFEGLTPEGKKFAKNPNTEYLKVVEQSNLDYLKELKNINIEQAEHRRKEVEARQEDIKKLRELPRLESDYRDYYTYYYDESKNQIFLLESFTYNIRPATYKQEIHLRKLNNISKEVDMINRKKESPWDGPIDYSNMTNLNKESEYEKIYKDIVIDSSKKSIINDSILKVSFIKT